MIPVSLHGEFAPIIKFLYRVRPKILSSCYVVVIELLNVFEEQFQSTYV